MGPPLHEKMAKPSLGIVIGGEPTPHLVSFINQNTDALNATITPGGIGQDRGEQLKYGDADTGGPFFVNIAINVATRMTVVT